MRLNVRKTVVVGVVCLVIWVAFTYVSFTNSPLGARTEGDDYKDVIEKVVVDKILKLERELNAELEGNKDMLLEIKKRLSEKHEVNEMAISSKENTDEGNISIFSLVLTYP